MGGGLMQLVAYGAQIFTLRVTRKSLSSRLSTADTLTSRWKPSSRPLTELPHTVEV